MEGNSLECRACNAVADGPSQLWRRCRKCGMLWCPKCAPVEGLCSNCIGGELGPA
jgi:hypothetical protein